MSPPRTDRKPRPVQVSPALCLYQVDTQYKQKRFHLACQVSYVCRGKKNLGPLAVITLFENDKKKINGIFSFKFNSLFSRGKAGLLLQIMSQYWPLDWQRAKGQRREDDSLHVAILSSEFHTSWWGFFSRLFFYSYSLQDCVCFKFLCYAAILKENKSVRWHAASWFLKNPGNTCSHVLHRFQGVNPLGGKQPWLAIPPAPP